MKFTLNTHQRLQDSTIIRESLRTDLGEAQSLDLIEFVQRKTVVNANRNDNKISRKDLNADPSICGILCVSELVSGEELRFADTLQTSYVPVTGARENISDLRVFVHVPARWARNYLVHDGHSKVMDDS